MFENDKPTWLGLVWYTCHKAGILEWTNFFRFLLIVMVASNTFWLLIYIFWAWFIDKEISEFKNTNKTE